MILFKATGLLFNILLYTYSFTLIKFIIRYVLTLLFYRGRIEVKLSEKKRIF